MRNYRSVLLDDLLEISDQINNYIHREIIVSMYLGNDKTIYELPVWHDPVKHRRVQLLVMGGAAYKELLKHAAFNEETKNIMPSFSGIPIRFSPQDWRP